MRHILALDQGTTGSTAIVFGEDGSVKGRGYHEITQRYPVAGEVEHDPAELLEKTVAAGRAAIDAAGVSPDTIGITNQRETVIVWDRATGRALAPAIVWQDRRTSARCKELESSAARIAELTGLRPDPYFSATKIEHLFARPEISAKVRTGDVLVGTVDSWLIWNLTGGRVHASDPTNASRTMLYDIGRKCWSEEMCSMFSVPLETLPEVRTSAGSFGDAETGFFGRAIPISGVAGDQQAALYGHGCWEEGQAKNTYGTGAFLLLNTGARRPAATQGMLATIACDAHGNTAYALEASIFGAGAAVQWLRDGLGILDNAGETAALAASLESNGGVYFVPALSGLGAPHWEPAARGMISGLTGGATRAHLARAALEAMAYGTADVLDAMSEAAGIQFAALRVDGGASANDWMIQFQADVLGIPVERPDMVEATAFGAAALAGVGADFWTSPDEIVNARPSRVFHPAANGTASTDGRAGWRRATRAALSWARDTDAAKL